MILKAASDVCAPATINLSGKDGWHECYQQIKDKAPRDFPATHPGRLGRVARADGFERAYRRAALHAGFTAESGFAIG
jgi:hypothetical protein